VIKLPWRALTFVKAKPSTRRERFAAWNQWMFSVSTSPPLGRMMT
jgi:hypothetical protein